MRQAGKIPAVLYGHGEDNVSLSVPADMLEAAVQHGSRVVTLEGAVKQTAFIRELQWDVWSRHVQHVDFTRVSADEKVEVSLAVELRGEAPGVKEGGVVEQLLHEIDLECPVASIPEKMSVSINKLALDESIKVADLEIPEGATLVGDASAVVVQCITPLEAPEEEEAAAGEDEPEVIGRKEEEESDEE
jgi:large subunit ribosomal protein L25